MNPITVTVRLQINHMKRKTFYANLGILFPIQLKPKYEIARRLMTFYKMAKGDEVGVLEVPVEDFEDLKKLYNTKFQRRMLEDFMRSRRKLE